MAALGEEENWPPPSYAEAKKMKSLTLHPHGCPRAAKGYSSSSSSSTPAQQNSLFHLTSLSRFVIEIIKHQ